MEPNANSGIYIHRRYEVQLSDTYQKEDYKYMGGSIYRQKLPDYNMGKPPGEWQSYDIIFRSPRYHVDEMVSRKVESARITVIHNGVAIQNNVIVHDKTGAGFPETPEPGPIMLQDHESVVQYRNIWIVPSERDQIAAGANIPKILIIGDSISGGYTPFVREHFKDKAIISHNPGNAKHTGWGLENIRDWIGDEEWDIIHFNWGLWDLAYRHPDSKLQGNRDKVNGKLTFSVDQYKANLDSLVTIMKEISDAKLIFTTTTYVPEQEPGRYARDARRYNKAAIEVMKKHSVLVNDIYEESIPIHKAYGIGPDDVHFTEKGNEKLSRFIIDFIEKEI